MKKYKTIMLTLVLVVFLAGACGLPFSTKPTAALPTPGSSPVNPTQPAVDATPSKPIEVNVNLENVHLPPFAEYEEFPVRLPDKTASDYALPLDKNSLKNLSSYNLSPAQEAKLLQNGFVVVDPIDSDYNEFFQIYENIRYYENQTAFITTDSIYHVYHLLFDKILRDLERESFTTALTNLTQGLLQASLQQYQSVTGTPLEEAALRNTAFLAVAARLLDSSAEIPEPARQLAEAELKLIEARESVAVSPIWDQPSQADALKYREDYSQYIPRGHYTLSEQLERYFKAMMWYGRMTLRLRDGQETQRALLLSHILRSQPELEKSWNTIYQATTFLVGKSDDLSFHEYGVLADQVFGANPDLLQYADDNKLGAFMNAAEALPPPQVNSMWVWIDEDKEEAIKGFRVMGQRFTLDAYVFGQVTWRNVGTLDTPRDLPKAMDFMAAMGSDEARQILTEMEEFAYANYEKQLDKVTGEVASLETDSWTQNVYWNWLYTFKPLIELKDERYPSFMRTQAWNRKELNTALGSFTELKHDTILYAKQTMAEMGGGEMEQPPQNYVEPNPLAFSRLRSLAVMTMKGLDANQILSDHSRASLENLINLLAFLQTIAEKQLNGDGISPEEYGRLVYFGGELEALTLAAADSDNPSDRNLYDQKAALVADIATGMNRVLEEAIGRPALIYMVSPDAPHTIHMGAVFSYYEFEVAPADRMTDETWREKVDNKDLPPLPRWTESFISR